MVLFWFFVVLAAIVTYVIFMHMAIEILDKVKCEGTFVEWFACYCPIWHILIYVKYKNVCEFKTIKSIIFDLKRQYETMNNKLNKYK